jgi:hypothetical protein
MDAGLRRPVPIFPRVDLMSMAFLPIWVSMERRTHLTRYRIYRKSAGETTYISAHEENKLRNPREFPNLDIALAALRRCGIPEYEITRVTKELGAINGAIVQVPEPIVFAELSETLN